MVHWINNQPLVLRWIRLRGRGLVLSWQLLPAPGCPLAKFLQLSVRSMVFSVKILAMLGLGAALVVYISGASDN